MAILGAVYCDPLVYLRMKGTDKGLAQYLDPRGFFEKIYLLSPLESEEKVVDGVHVVPTKDVRFPWLVKELGIDIVRGYGGNWPADMVCYFRVDGVPAVVSVHDRRAEMLYRSIAHADIIMCVSEQVRELVLARHVDPARVWLRPNGVDLSVMHRVDPQEWRTIAETLPFSRTILHVGRKSPEKNIASLVRALTELGQEWGLVAIGPWDRQGLQELATNLGVAARCVFLETVPNAELPKYYSLADVFCLPSLTEAMSNVVLEAFACECPTVLSEAAAVGVGAVHGQEAVLVKDPEDGKALANAIMFMASGGPGVGQMVSKALERARTFDLEVTSQKELEQYRTILRMRDAGCFKVGMIKKLMLYVANAQVRCHRALTGKRG